MLWIYLGVVTAGLLSGRVLLVGIQSGLAGSRPVFAFVGLLAALFLLSLLVWGLVVLAWYWALLGFTLGLAAAWIAIRPGNFTFWYGASPALYTATAIGGIYLWFWHWPF